MRNRLISFFIIMCMLLPCITVPVYAKEAPGVDSAEQAYELLSDLGIFDSIEGYESVKNEKITRGALALYVSRVFALNYTEPGNKFSDVDADTNTGKAVLSLVSAGILNGYEDGTMRPDEYATLTELATISLRALGYKVFDNWTAVEYLSKAKDLDLLDGVNNRNIITMGDCTVVLYNTLHTSCVIAGDISQKFDLRETKTPLEMFFGLKYVKGLVTDNNYASLSGERLSSPDKVGIDYILYDTENQKIKEMLGYRVVAYVTIDEEIIKYCYLDSKRNSLLDIDFTRFVGYNGSHIEYYKDEAKSKTKKIKLSSDAVILKNSVLVETDYESAFNIDNGIIRLISHKTNSNEYNVVLIDTYENYMVTSVDVGNRIIYTDSTDEHGNRIKFNLDDTAYVDIRMTPYNKSVNENTIEPDDLLCLSISDDGQVIRGFLCENTISGKIEGILHDGEDSYIVINGQQCKLIADIVSKYSLVTGMSGTFTLDAFNRVALYSKEASYIDNIGYIYGLFEDEEENNSEYCYNNRGHMPCMVCNGYYRLYPL